MIWLILIIDVIISVYLWFTHKYWNPKDVGNVQWCNKLMKFCWFSLFQHLCNFFFFFWEVYMASDCKNEKKKFIGARSSRDADNKYIRKLICMYLNYHLRCVCRSCRKQNLISAIYMTNNKKTNNTATTCVLWQVVMKLYVIHMPGTCHIYMQFKCILSIHIHKHLQTHKTHKHTCKQAQTYYTHTC